MLPFSHLSLSATYHYHCLLEALTWPLWSNVILLGIDFQATINEWEQKCSVLCERQHCCPPAAGIFSPAVEHHTNGIMSPSHLSVPCSMSSSLITIHPLWETKACLGSPLPQCCEFGDSSMMSGLLITFFDVCLRLWTVLPVWSGAVPLPSIPGLQ